MLANLVLLWLAALPLMGSPGPATLSTAAVGASFGARRGLPYLLGIVAGTAVVLGLIATGVTAAVLALPALKAAITLLAAGYILYLAWRIATAPPLLQDAGAAKAPAFPGGFLLAVANPKAFAAIGAVYAGHSVVPGDLALDASVKIAALVPVIVLVNAVWLVSGTLLARALHDPRKSRIANVIFAVLLVASVALALI
jgi:threonine/homoserine/homoserine lactone efflux protein